MKYSEATARRLSKSHKWWVQRTDHGLHTDLGAGCDSAKRQRRAGSALGKQKMPCLYWELLQFFTDEIESLNSRADSALLLSQALRLRDMLVDQGYPEEECPNVDKHWLYRWRQRFGITHRMTTVRFKISAKDIAGIWGATVGMSIHEHSVECPRMRP